MALVSSFYDGVVTEGDRARNRAGAPDYGVYGTSDFQVITNGSVPFSVLVRAGRAHGWGITDKAVTNQTVMCDAPATGVTRWDLIVVRRNWQALGGGPSTLVAVKGGSTTVIPAGRKVGPGVEDDQPLALVCWKGGQSAPYQIIDLRCWANNGGLEIANEIAFEYLERPGACVRLDGLDWRFARKANGAWVWMTDPNATHADPGLMSPADKKKLDAAGPSSAANKIMMTGADGYINVRSDPLQTYHPASKYYVDAAIKAARSYAASQASAALSAAKTYAASQASAAKTYAAGLVTNFRRAASGERYVGALAAGASYPNQEVSFPGGRFSSPPNVTFTGASSRQSFSVQSVSKSKCVFTCSNWTPGAAPAGNVQWIAVQA